MLRTDFAGLTQLEPGESPWQDGGTVFGRNQETIDHFLRQVIEHRHDAHPPLTDPATAPALTTQDVGGTLPADTTIRVAFTAIDADGGETLVSPTATIDTPPPGDQPAAFAGIADYTAGDLPDGTYYYVLTATDGAGGETPPSDPVTVVLEEGHANGQVALSGFTAALAGAAGWRLYRSVNGGTYGFLAAGNAATDGYTDDTSAAADVQLTPPDDLANGTVASAQVTATVAAVDLPANTVSYRLYASTDPAFPSPSLVGEWLAADAGTPHVITTLALEAEQPPPVSTSKGGAHKITLTELADEVNAAIAAGGGGGGTLGPLHSGDQIDWLRADDVTPFASLIASEGGGSLARTNSFGPTDYNPAPATFDVGAGASLSELVAKAGTSEADLHLGIGSAEPLAGDGYMEGVFTIATAAAGWDVLGVGSGELDRAGNGLFAVLDRASGELRLTWNDGTGATVLASIAYTAVVDASTATVRVTRTFDPVAGTYAHHVSLAVDGIEDVTLDYAGPEGVGWTLYAQLVLGWTDPTAFTVSEVTQSRVGEALVYLQVYDSAGMAAQKTLLTDTGISDGSSGYVSRQKAGIVLADGSTPGDTCMVDKTGVGTYDVTYWGGLVNDGVIVVITTPDDAVISNVSEVGFTATFAADTDFRFIAVAQP